MSALDDVQEEVKPDMTPMIDVVFLMIIFFICIDFKVLESKLPAYLPKDKGSNPNKVEPQEQLSIKVYVDKVGTPEYPAGVDKNSVNINTGRAYRFKLKDHTLRGVPLLEEACRGRGWLLPGGVCDTDRGAAVILDEFRAGKLGRITLQKAPAKPQNTEAQP